MTCVCLGALWQSGPIWMSHVTYEWVMSPMSLGTQQCFTSGRDALICAVTHLCVKWLIRTWHDVCIDNTMHWYVTSPIRVWHGAFTDDAMLWCPTRLIRMWHDSFVCDTVHSFMTRCIDIWRDSLVCDMAHVYVTRLKIDNALLWCLTFLIHM